MARSSCLSDQKSIEPSFVSTAAPFFPFRDAALCTRAPHDAFAPTIGVRSSTSFFPALKS